MNVAYITTTVSTWHECMWLTSLREHLPGMYVAYTITTSASILVFYDSIYPINNTEKMNVFKLFSPLSVKFYLKLYYCST